MFTTNPADSTNLVINYTSTTYIGTINGTYCQPIINSFTDTVIPGAYYQNNPQNLAYMIIHGENFGPDQGIVYMPNADTGGLAYIPLNYLDIKTWNDSTIVLTMPSIIDSFPNILNPTYPTPGSGTFYVRTNNNDSAFSPHQVFCPYAISNIPYNTSWYRKVRVDLADMDSLGGYTFRPDLNVMSFPDPMFKWCIINGLEEWICATSINWKFGLPLNHYINSWYSDDTSTIFLVPVVPLRPWALASTKSFYDVCGILNDTGSYIFAKEIDIAIKATPTPYIWFCDTSFFHDKPANTYDFHAVWIHEAGHGHQLLHSDQNYDIMWWQFGHNYEHFWDRRYIQDEDRDGGRNVVQKSVADSFSIFCSHNHGDLIELPGNCVYGGDNVKELNPKVVSFKAYPNPINNSLLTIAYELIKDAPVQFILLDNLGKEVFNLNRTITAGKHTDQMSLRNQDAGIYYLEVIIDGIGDSQKLIKLH